METLVKLITEKTGISQSQATTAVNTVVSFLKERMPAGVGSQVESFISNSDQGAFSGVKDNIASKVGGIFGTK